MDIELTSAMRVQIVDHMGGDSRVVAAARVSTMGAQTTEEESSGLIRALMNNRHGSPFEHGSMTFLIEAPIFVFREWHRHRVGWSYNEESARYKQLRPKFYVPPPHRPMVQTGKPMNYEFSHGTMDQYMSLREVLRSTYQVAYDGYAQLLEAGVAREVARMQLPVGIYSSMYATCNPRSMMHFLELRTHMPEATRVSHPQWEIDSCAVLMEAKFAALWPLTYKAWTANGRMAP